MNATEVYKNFYSQLVNTLPIKDAIFSAKLNGKGLYSGDLENEVNAKVTDAKGTTLFLNKAIKPYLNNKKDDNPFWKLLSVMDEFDSQPLKNLAKQITQELLNCERGSTS